MYMYMYMFTDGEKGTILYLDLKDGKRKDMHFKNCINNVLRK